jgi:hypothetical protein
MPETPLALAGSPEIFELRLAAQPAFRYAEVWSWMGLFKHGRKTEERVFGLRGRSVDVFHFIQTFSYLAC